MSETSKVDLLARMVKVDRCFLRNDQDQILFLQRVDGKMFGGLWEVPGGKLESGYDCSHSLEREVREETGLVVRVDRSGMVYRETSVIGEGSPYAGIAYEVTFSLASVVWGRFKISHEHQDSKWLTYDEAWDLDLTPEVHKALGMMKDLLT